MFIMEYSSTSSLTARPGQLVDAAIQFSDHLRALLLDKATESRLRDLSDEIENQIQSLKAYSPRSLHAEHHGRLKTAGLALWNWCTQEKRREDDENSQRDKFLSLVRVLSFSMLALAKRSDDVSLKTITHLERLAIKTGRSCIESNEFEFALWALQKAVEYNGQLQHLQDSPSEESRTCSQFEAEYNTLRIVLAWKEDRMDIAEHLYTSIGRPMTQVDTALAEKLADALFEIGRDLTLKKNSVLAVKWLERALDIINAQEISQLSRDAIELRLAISQVLIQAYLDIGSPDYIDRAENHIAYIEEGLGDKLVVLLFRTEVLLRSPAEVFDSKAYADILRRMMRAVDMSESSFKLLIHHIRKLSERNNVAASSVLDDFLIACIFPSRREQWVDKGIVLRTDMAVRGGSAESMQALEAILDQILPITGNPLSANTAAGIQTLIWKKADAEFSLEKYGSAAKWCQIALHPAFEQSGPSNRGKIARKLLLCAIQQNDLSAAGDILQTMDDVALKEPMTAYLAFKVALKKQDVEGALRCLEQISQASSLDPQYLYACCLEAQQAQDKVITIKALQHVVLKHGTHASNAFHLPALFRILIRLEVSVLNDEEETGLNKELLVEDLCNIFRAAASEIEKEARDKKSDKLFTVDELNWFCKNAYNLGLENALAWEARHIIVILECCLSIISSYPPDVPAQMAADTSLRSMFCNFMAATVLLALARSEDNTEIQLQDYLNMCRHVRCFHETLESKFVSLEEASRGDLQTKLSTLLVFEFEGATCLKSWDDLKGIILKAQPGQSLLAYQAMADCILRCQFVPDQVLYQTMRELVNQIWILEHFGDVKLAKYMRCLLKTTLSMEHKIPLNLIEEISTMVKELAGKKKHFPPVELEWITITAFNHGVDLYGMGEDELSKTWVSHALTLAHYLRDGHELERQLQEKYTKLKWQENRVDDKV
ncbi:meiosis protein SPO22/ZIP4 like-domain-containing protein [Xylaria arbuscula]|nr:meiosis protein SPO22/ZIP4 like-domain-containing protein [Xylaria arbuscula]